MYCKYLHDVMIFLHWSKDIENLRYLFVKSLNWQILLINKRNCKLFSGSYFIELLFSISRYDLKM